jgi:hypothetical protein
MTMDWGKVSSRCTGYCVLQYGLRNYVDVHELRGPAPAQVSGCGLRNVGQTWRLRAEGEGMEKKGTAAVFVSGNLAWCASSPVVCVCIEGD